MEDNIQPQGFGGYLFIHFFNSTHYTKNYQFLSNKFTALGGYQTSIALSGDITMSIITQALTAVA